MFRLNVFIDILKEDTKKGIVQWSNVGGGWRSDDFCSVDYYDTNKVLYDWIEEKIFSYDNWDNAFITEVKIPIENASAYIIVCYNEPNVKYELYLQPDAESPIVRLRINSASIKELYMLITQQYQDSKDSYLKIDEFLDFYINSHAEVEESERSGLSNKG